MRQSKLLIPTLREGASEAEAASHQLMLRAGLIRPLAAGIYTYLPLGRRVLRKVENIVREEMDRAGGQEVLMPALQPAQLWTQSGRYEQYGPELIRLHDRGGREFALGPTHEEVITALADNEITSYRQLPVTLYQIQTKFRDELRPRYGLLRGREFLMKDAYSFDADWESLDRSYQHMYQAYIRIFERCGLNYRAVEADAGTIGGEGGTHEFMALADIGEDTICSCDACSYAANLEKAQFKTAVPASAVSSTGYAATEVKPLAEAAFSSTTAEQASLPIRLITPNIRTIEELEAFTGLEARAMLKTLIYKADGRPLAVVVRGDHSVNEIKLKNLLGASSLELADRETTEQVTGAAAGFAGPVGLSAPIYGDFAAAAMEKALTGANETDYHFAEVQPGVHFSFEQVADLRNAVPGDGCPRCAEGTLQFHRGIEIGHVFKLGTKYSEAMKASFTASTGEVKPFIMGCYGIGISRVLSAVIEQNHDEAGIHWPLELAPYHVHILPIAVKDTVQMELAEELAEKLRQAGAEVLIDDRDERAGVKFKDSDLIGIPHRIVIGKHAAERKVELKGRNAESELVFAEEAVQRMKEQLRVIER